MPGGAVDEFFTPDFGRLAVSDRRRLPEYKRLWIAPLAVAAAIALTGVGFLIAGYAPFRMLDGVILLCVAFVIASLSGFPFEEWQRRRNRIDAVARIAEEWGSLRYFAYPTYLDAERLERLYDRLYGGQEGARP